MKFITSSTFAPFICLFNISLFVRLFHSVHNHPAYACACACARACACACARARARVCVCVICHHFLIARAEKLHLSALRDVKMSAEIMMSNSDPLSHCVHNHPACACARVCVCVRVCIVFIRHLVHSALCLSASCPFGIVSFDIVSFGIMSGHDVCICIYVMYMCICFRAYN